MRRRAVRANEKGVALLQAILFVALLVTVVMVISTIRIAAYQSAQHARAELAARCAAEAGIAEAMASLIDTGDAPSSATGRSGGATYETTVRRSGDGSVVISAVGSAGPVSRRVEVIGNVTGDTFAVRRWDERAGS